MIYDTDLYQKMHGIVSTLLYDRTPVAYVKENIYYNRVEVVLDKRDKQYYLILISIYDYKTETRKVKRGKIAKHLEGRNPILKDIDNIIKFLMSSGTKSSVSKRK